MKDYYEVLGVSATSDFVVIKAAYKAMMLKHHPDTNTTPGASGKAKELNEAYAILSDPQRRAAYDSSRESNAKRDKQGTAPPPPFPENDEPSDSAKDREEPRKAYGVKGAYVLAAIAIAIALFGVLARSDSSASNPTASFASASPDQTEAPVIDPTQNFEKLAVGESFEWDADKERNEVLRQAGPFSIKITKNIDKNGSYPTFEIMSGGKSLRIDGESNGVMNFPQEIGFFYNRPGEPALILQSYTGGAHCCEHIQIISNIGGQIKSTDLGAWDGESINIPKDVSGDGVVDFIFSDNRFLYSFSSYAQSYAPPKIVNVIAGKMLDVSSRREFQNLFLVSFKKSGAVCRSDPDGTSRNGACPAYVASAARIGRLEQAWLDMQASYDPTTDWTYPTGCQVKVETDCPANLVINYTTYPESLLSFLKENGYVRRSWQPPGSSELPANQGE